MSAPSAGFVFLALLMVALVAVHAPLGDYMYRVYSSKRDWRVERVIYRIVGADPKAQQAWDAYAFSILAFSAVSIVFLFFLQLLQGKLPLHLHDPATPMTASLAWNTAVSFVSNTSWQAYSGESTQGHLVQMAGIAVQSFLSGAVGMSVAIALVRGFARAKTDQLGNFWVDLVRGTIRILLPISLIGAIVLMAGGVIQNFHLNDQVVTTLGGVQRTITGGPVASQEAIKLIGSDGGGFYNANSAHPFENPTAWTNLIEIFLLLVISFSLPRTFGRIVGNKKQGYAIVAVMAVLAIISTGLMMLFQSGHHGTVPTATGAATEGIEQRFGIADSSIFAEASTLTSSGAVDSMHDSYTSLGGLMAMFNMQLGEVAPGGVGSGLYGMLILAVVTVFIAGLMVGRTPEYLGKKIESYDVKMSMLYVLIFPLIILTLAAAFVLMPSIGLSALSNQGPHGLTEILYAFTSATGNNGSAFAGLNANTWWYNVVLGWAMLGGRFLMLIPVLALAGNLAMKKSVPPSPGTFPVDGSLFTVLLIGVILILGALTFFPALSLGPILEHLLLKAGQLF